MNFKILAIRPNENCEGLKNLRVGHLYKFYNDYDFSDNDESIKEKIDVPENLYNLSEDQNITISAVVGKNGSGKSALVELLIKSIMKISLILRNDFVNPDEIYNDTDKKERFNESLRKDLSNLRLEFYYISQSDIPYIDLNNILRQSVNRKLPIIRKIKIDGHYFTFTDYLKKGDIYEKSKTVHCDVIRKSKYTENFLEDFFYTMIVNYSFYGFNNSEIGEWVQGIFHKNDGYQLPVVINPYRYDGNIDINSEKSLTKSRFLVNILFEKELRKITEKKTILNVLMKFDYSKFKINSNGRLESIFSNSDYEKEEILKIIIKYFFDENLVANKNNDFYEYTLEYILTKIYKITKYPLYKKFRYLFESKTSSVGKEILLLPDLMDYLYLLAGDTSHNTFKLRQALYFIISGYLNKEDLDEIFEIDLLYSKLVSDFNLIKDTIKDKDGKIISGYEFSVNESLPSFFEVDFLFTSDPNSQHTFSNLSSGEKQKIFSINSVVYHLRNLFSISRRTGEDLNENIVSYNNINIVFDEIELYFHPQFQKSFIKDLLQSISVLRHSYSNRINIMFLTHSPFILSDIPKQNVLFLQDGISTDFKARNTFAANISNLLLDSFFVDNGLIGDFAIERINKTINYLNGKEITEEFNSSDFLKIINLVDEPILQKKLIEMYSEKFSNKEKLKYLRSELKRIQEEIDKEENS
ncbi:MULTISPECIES: hypothetical protein [Chryseobacterium]|uniref:hypothetical protein n=1 Tax=Chryseobacterium TaxID=59732 RepID=UPI00257772A1|nr:hypothetical protein [Chryseobacterium indologenes]MDM1556319.1 hypothetical protein [Chryseobacterium indologenes]